MEFLIEISCVLNDAGNIDKTVLGRQIVVADSPEAAVLLVDKLIVPLTKKVRSHLTHDEAYVEAKAYPCEKWASPLKRFCSSQENLELELDTLIARY